MTGAGDFSGTVTPGSYRFVRTLGHHGGRVHEARHDRLAGRFAVKVFSDVEPRAFRRRAQRASALRHPGIVQVVDYSATREQGFVVMEYVEGRSLAAIFAENGPLAAERVACLVDSIALGLQAAHRQGFAHGGLAPERIFVLPPSAGQGDDETLDTERTKLVGFGLGQELTTPRRRLELTSYTAPEQASRDADPRSDQFALAAIAYEALAGVSPFGDGPDRPDPPPIREYAPRVNVIVDDVIRRALSPEPSGRWPDIYTFSERLREAADTGGDHEERTRLAPLPLTVTRPTATPTPIEVAVIASVDVDLGTPAPQEIEIPILRGHAMSPGPVHLPPSSRGPTPHRSYPIRPTPTFSFSDDPGSGPLSRRPAPRRRSGGGGGFLLALVMLLAGFAGYVTVKYHAWQDTGPLVARATELANSLRSLAPAAPPDPSTVTAAAPRDTTAAPAPANPSTASVPALHPEVVPLAPPTAPAATVNAQAAPGPHRSSHEHRHRALKPLSAEAAAEEELLAAPVR